VLCVPLADLLPVQPPDAAQEVAFVELQVNSAAPPAATEAVLLVSVAVGATLTVTLAGLLVPPGPVQVREYVVPAASAPVLWVPPGAMLPLQPPEPIHAVAFVELQVNSEAALLASVLCEAVSAAVGGGGVADGLSPPPQATKSSKAPMAGPRESKRIAKAFSNEQVGFGVYPPNISIG
jgi:hypothetical protein